MLAFAEMWNGLEYYQDNKVSAYTFSGTNVYKIGKYDRDRHYNPKLKDKQAGTYILLKGLGI